MPYIHKSLMPAANPQETPAVQVKEPAWRSRESIKLEPRELGVDDTQAQMT